MRINVFLKLMFLTLWSESVSFTNDNECYVGAAVFIQLKADSIYSAPLGEAKTGDRERLSGAARLSSPVRPHGTCAHSWAPSRGGTGSAARGAPRTFPWTWRCRSRADRCSHPLTAPSLRSTQVGRTEKGQEIEEVRGNKEAQGLWGSLGRGCPRWCAPWRGGRSIPVHFLGQRAPPIPLGQGRKESRTREPREETRRCFCEAVIHSRTPLTGDFHSQPVEKSKKIYLGKYINRCFQRTRT